MDGGSRFMPKKYSCMTILGNPHASRLLLHLSYVHAHPTSPINRSSRTVPWSSSFTISHRLSSWRPYSWQAFSFLSLHAFWSSIVDIFSWSKLIFPKGAWGIEAESIHPCNRLVSNPTHQPPLNHEEIKTIPSSVKFFSSHYLVSYNNITYAFSRGVCLWWFPQFLFRLAK